MVLNALLQSMWTISKENRNATFSGLLHPQAHDFILFRAFSTSSAETVSNCTAGDANRITFLS